MRKNFLFFLIAFLIVILGVLAYFFIFPNDSQPIGENDTPDESSMLYPVGKVGRCAINPIFPFKHGLQPPLLIDLRQQGYRGVRIIENRVEGKILQLPGWSNFGWLGLYTLDNMGNIYLTSVPHESITHNPLGEQNRILRIDAKTGEMYEFIRLPQKKESTMRNPFGAMGLHFDCDNRYLYVTSIAGSTMREALGSIFQVDIQNKKVISRFEDVDAIGLSTFNTVKGKRLFYGDARKPEIYSIGLDDEGRFTGSPRFEFSLLEQPGGADDRAHRIRFIKDVMEVKANEFTFTLAAASDPHRNIYRFRYDEVADSWIFLDVHLQQPVK